MFQTSHETARRRKTKPLGPTKHPQTFTFQEPLPVRTSPSLRASRFVPLPPQPHPAITAYFQSNPTIQITAFPPAIPPQCAEQTQQTHPKPNPPEIPASAPATRSPPVAHVPPLLAPLLIPH